MDLLPDFRDLLSALADSSAEYLVTQDGVCRVASLRFKPFHSRAEVTVDSFATYDDDLAAEPSVDGRGITFLLMSQDHIGIVRRTALSGSPASLDDLAAVL